MDFTTIDRSYSCLNKCQTVGCCSQLSAGDGDGEVQAAIIK